MLWGRHDSDLLGVYRKIDECVGEVRRAFPSTPLIILSDHGFTSFDRTIHLNTWLKDRGFLNLTGQPGNDTTLDAIDLAFNRGLRSWPKWLVSKSEGPRRKGIVSSGEQSSALTTNLRDQLLAWRDPTNGRQIVESLYEVHASPQNADVAPDLIVGYAKGYRGSWVTALGGTSVSELQTIPMPGSPITASIRAEVPGVLFSSFRATTQPTAIRGVTGFILNFFSQDP